MIGHDDLFPRESPGNSLQEQNQRGDRDVSRILDIVQSRVAARATGLGGLVGIYIAGPIDKEYRPSVNNHHWEIATLEPLGVLGLLIDLNCCEVINEEAKSITDCHGWLSLTTHGKEHTLGVLLVFPQSAGNVWTPLRATNLGNGSYLPILVTFIGRHRYSGRKYRNVITQWDEELLKFFLGGLPPARR